jgi:hypothetical protein
MPPPMILEGDSDASAFASLAESEVVQLHDGITLTQWLSQRGEQGWRKIPEEPITSTSTPGPECLSYWWTAKLPSGAEVVLAVYFYPPPAPSPAVFPKPGAQDLINGCFLTVVRLEVATVTSDLAPGPARDAHAQEFGNALDQAVRQRFTKLYGESIGRKDDAVWGRGNFLPKEDVARWIHGAEIVSGHDPQGSPFGQLVLGPAVFVRAQLQLSGQAKHDHSEADGLSSIPKSQFHRAVALAKADAALSRRFEDLYERIFRSGSSEEEARRPENAKWRESLLPLLREWLAALKTAPPAQRAAGLLAADRLLEAAQKVVGGVPGWPEKPETHSELQKLGALFGMNGIAGYYFYAGNWEKEARELDPDGPAGKMAVIGWMDRGSCDIAGWGSDLIHNVISDGEGLLAKGLDAPTTAQVHFMVGDAYSDIFSIAKGYDPNGDYPNIQERDADPAHTKALEHYRAGLAIDNSSEDAKHAWNQAWHLSAGLLPTMRYVCFSD